MKKLKTKLGTVERVVVALVLGACEPVDPLPPIEANGCGSQVVIAFYEDANCTPDTEVDRRTYDTSLECFHWTAAGSNASDNSATRFQCYRDRLCYTQHPGTFICEGGAHGRTDKEARTDVCLKEPAGVLYSKILSGTELCPPAPAGFACPSSAAEQGTAGVVACGG